MHPASCGNAGTAFDSPEVAWRVATAETDAVAWSDVDGSDRVGDLHETMRDFVVRKKDQTPAYQLASLTDDLHFDVNFIVRGEDLVDSTAAQRLLATKLGVDRFLDAKFLHHCLVTDVEGEKLSKSGGAASLKAMRESLAEPTRLYQRVSELLGIEGPIGSAREALAAWTI